MDFELKAEQVYYREQFRNFAKLYVEPIASKIDDQESFPEQTVQLLAQRGWLGLTIDKSYGGLGLDPLTYALCIEEISSACASTGVILSSHTSLCAETIQKAGTKQQKDRFLRPLAQGMALGAFALTEPQAGSDLQAIETTAKLVGNHYILSGKKQFITNAGYAQTYIVFARTQSKEGRVGLSGFIVDCNTPGFFVERIIPKMGIRASSTGILSLQKCSIPRGNLLGEFNLGSTLIQEALDRGRIGIAAQALGIARGAYNLTDIYVKSRQQFKKPISSFQHIKFEMAEMKTRIQAAQLLVYWAASLSRDSCDYTEQAAMAKLYASQLAMDVTTRCVQLHGGYGYTRDLPLERMMRDAKITEIYEGTNEVMRMIIASYSSRELT